MNNLRGAKIIYQESKATQPSHLYFLQKDANNFDIIVTSESGVKRRLNSSVDLSSFYKKTETYSQTEINDFLYEKQEKLSSFDESILIENDGNIEVNVSLFEESFEQQECELTFEPLQIVAVYQDGIKLLNSEYEIILPKKIKIKEYVDENIQIEYTHLKS